MGYVKTWRRVSDLSSVLCQAYYSARRQRALHWGDCAAARSPCPSTARHISIMPTSTHRRMPTQIIHEHAVPSGGGTSFDNASLYWKRPTLYRFACLRAAYNRRVPIGPGIRGLPIGCTTDLEIYLALRGVCYEFGYTPYNKRFSPFFGPKNGKISKSQRNQGQLQNTHIETHSKSLKSHKYTPKITKIRVVKNVIEIRK